MMVFQQRIIRRSVVGAQKRPASVWAAVLIALVQEQTMKEQGIAWLHLHVCLLQSLRETNQCATTKVNSSV